jgi:hypothetical protein
MGDKLVHLSDEAHAMLHRYLEDQGLKGGANAFVSGLIINEVRNRAARVAAADINNTGGDVLPLRKSDR